MSKPGNLYDSVYDNFANSVLARVRSEAFGEDIGQNSWLTVDEYRGFLALLELNAEMSVLDVCCGSGGPALFLARQVGCRVTGIDQSESGIRDANRIANEEGLEGVAFSIADANQPLVYEPGSYDAIISIDAINHLADRLAVFREFRRMLAPAGRLLFTDAITVTGILSSDEVAARSGIGAMNFAPPGENERLLKLAGFEVRHVRNVSDNVTLTSARRYEARERYRDDLIRIEGHEVFSAMQCFLMVAHRLSSEQRLSRFVFLAVRLDQ